MQDTHTGGRHLVLRWRGAAAEGVNDKPHSRRNKGRWKGTALSVPKNVPPKPLPSPLGRGCPGVPGWVRGWWAKPVGAHDFRPSSRKPCAPTPIKRVSGQQD